MMKIDRQLLHDVANRQTNGQTHVGYNITYLAQVITQSIQGEAKSVPRSKPELFRYCLL